MDMQNENFEVKMDKEVRKTGRRKTGIIQKSKQFNKLK